MVVSVLCDGDGAGRNHRCKNHGSIKCIDGHNACIANEFPSFNELYIV